MTAMHKIKRELTAKEMAKKLNTSERTVRSLIAMPRKDYEEEAESRRRKAFLLRQNGMKWKEVAEEMNTTLDAVKSLAKRYKQQDQEIRG
ncbi:plasmid replication protein [Escherichia coli]|nr:plasmid replication protein [Escherichia coli]